MNRSGPRNKRRWITNIAGLVVTILCLFLFFRQLNWLETIEAFEKFKWSYLLFGIGSLALGYGLRIARWRLMLNAAGANVSFTECSAPFLAAISLNNVLPLRLGDVVRALVFPKAMGITKVSATSSLVLERLVDLMTLLSCLVVGVLSVRLVAIPEALRSTAITLAAACGIILIIGLLFSTPLGQFFTHLSKKNRKHLPPVLAKIYATIGGLMMGFGMMCRPKGLSIMLAISVLIWCCEAGLFYFVLLGSGMEATPFIALLVMAVATLSTLVPSAPGYVGSFHLAVFTAIALIGGGSAQSGSYAVIVHLALWLPTTLAGALAIWARPVLFLEARSQIS